MLIITILHEGVYYHTEVTETIVWLQKWGRIASIIPVEVGQSGLTHILEDGTVRDIQPLPDYLK